MMTMVVDSTVQLAPIVWTMVAALFATGGVILGMSLPVPLKRRVGPLRLATVAGGAGFALGVLILMSGHFLSH